MLLETSECKKRAFSMCFRGQRPDLLRVISPTGDYESFLKDRMKPWDVVAVIELKKSDVVCASSCGQIIDACEYVLRGSPGRQLVVGLLLAPQASRVVLVMRDPADMSVRTMISEASTHQVAAANLWTLLNAPKESLGWVQSWPELAGTTVLGRGASALVVAHEERALKCFLQPGSDNLLERELSALNIVHGANFAMKHGDGILSLPKMTAVQAPLLHHGAVQSVWSQLRKAHESSMTHNDVRSSNILLDKHDHAYLMDWAFAEDIGGQVGRCGTLATASDRVLAGQDKRRALDDAISLARALLLSVLPSKCNKFANSRESSRVQSGWQSLQRDETWSEACVAIFEIQKSLNELSDDDTRLSGLMESLIGQADRLTSRSSRA